MQQSFDISDVQTLFPEHMDWDQFQHYSPDVPFSEPVVEFLSDFSASLLKDRMARIYPDVVTFAFFCRKANLLRLKQQYTDDHLRLGRGIVFHIAPSNVPVNFGYSLVAGLLAGNYNVVRASSKEFPQVGLIVKHLKAIASAHEAVARRIGLVRYGHDSVANDFFSSICQVRVIWGGDQTIARLRQSPLPSRSYDITFADRYSFAVINADEMIHEEHLDKVAEGFYNDTYLFDQNACSAPHLVVWLGSTEAKQRAKMLFWKALHTEIEKRKYHFQDIMAVDKLTTFYRQAVGMPIHKNDCEDNELVRVSTNTLQADIDEYRGKCGYFTEIDFDAIDAVTPIVKYNYQTVAVYGLTIDAVREFILKNRLVGIDRFVRIGDTTAFSLTWDGYNLIQTLSREVTIQN